MREFRDEENVTTVIECDTLDEFWETVSPIGTRFGKDSIRRVFRGQGNSAWNLVPNAYREECYLKYEGAMCADFKGHSGHVLFETWLLHVFMGFCNSSGLTIPGNYLELTKLLSPDLAGKSSFNEDVLFDERLFPLMALAQHHGLPTRLLDWSYDPFVASYFAATYIIRADREEIEIPKNLAVFSLNLAATKDGDDIRHVIVPATVSKNLSSQSGCFIWVKHTGWREEQFQFGASLEQRLPRASEYLTKVTLPMRFAGDLLQRCMKFGVSAAKIFPGYDGAAKSVTESEFSEIFKQKYNDQSGT